jgi:hypothetical protein
VTFSAFVAAYLDGMRQTQRRSEKTIEAYSRDLKQAVQFLGEEIELSAIDPTFDHWLGASTEFTTHDWTINQPQTIRAPRASSRSGEPTSDPSQPRSRHSRTQNRESTYPMS